MVFWQIMLSTERSQLNFLQAFMIDSGITRITAMDYDNRQSKYTVNGNYSKYVFPLSMTAVSRDQSPVCKQDTCGNNSDISPLIHTISVWHLRPEEVAIRGEIARFRGSGEKYSPAAGPGKALQRPTLTESVKAKAEWQQQLAAGISITPVYQLTSYHPSGQAAIHPAFPGL